MVWLCDGFRKHCKHYFQRLESSRKLNLYHDLNYRCQLWILWHRSPFYFSSHLSTKPRSKKWMQPFQFKSFDLWDLVAGDDPIWRTLEQMSCITLFPSTGRLWRKFQSICFWEHQSSNLDTLSRNRIFWTVRMMEWRMRCIFLCN